MIKTHLGEATNGIYSINWSVGDEINVNGQISEPPSEEEHGLNNARFTGEAHKSINIGVITEEDASDKIIWKCSTTKVTKYRYEQKQNSDYNHDCFPVHIYCLRKRIMAIYADKHHK